MPQPGNKQREADKIQLLIDEIERIRSIVAAASADMRQDLERALSKNCKPDQVPA